MNFIEYEFSNISGTPMEFFYIIGTDSGEFAYGRIDLEANDTRLLGWLFSASSIIFFDAAEPDSAAAYLDKMERGGYQPGVVP